MKINAVRMLPCVVVLTLMWAGNVFAAATYANTSFPFSWVDATTHTKVGPTTGGAYGPSYKFNNVGGCGTTPPIIDDTLSDQIPLGFNFVFGGQSFDSLRIMSNGRLQLTSQAVPVSDNITCGFGSPVTQLPLPNAGLNNTLRIYGNDLDPTLKGEGAGYTTLCVNRATCFVSFASLGTAPNRTFVVTWSNVPEWTNTSTTGGNYNLQVILQENGEFIYQFGTDVAGPAAATAQVGWQVNTVDYDVPQVGFPGNNTAIKFFIPTPLAQYQMEQAIWSGAPGEVLDTSGNGRNASVVGGVQTIAGGKVCRGADIPQNANTNNIDAIDTGMDMPATVGGVGTITFWYKANSAWSGGVTQDAQLLDATVVNNQWFFLVRRNTGQLRFVITDSTGTVRAAQTSAISVAAGTWKHIAVSWNFNALAGSNQDHMLVYVDGALQTTLAFTTAGTLSSQIGTLYIGDNRSAFTGSNGTGRSTDGVIDEFRIYNYEGGVGLIQQDMNATHTCAVLPVTPGGFNTYETSTAAGAITGVIKTKVAGSAVSADIVALNTAKTAIQTSFTGTVRVEILDSSNNSGALDANNCRPTWSTIQTLSPDPTFVTGDNGRKTISFTVPNAYRDARVRITYPAGAPTVTGCSTDNFAIRPSSIAVAVTDTNWSTAGTTRALANTGASGGNVHKAGQPFTITVTPSPGTATNYDGSPSVGALACTLPAVCANGTLAVGAFAGSGTRMSTTTTYSEDGAFNLTLVDQIYASVDAGDGTPADCSAAGLYVCQSPAPVAVGRFVPDHFAVTAVTQPVFRTFDASDAVCTTPPSGAVRSFTYIGQFFGYQSQPVAMVLAQNAGNGTTTNYRGALWKLIPASVSQTMANSPVMPLDVSQIGAAALSETANTGTGTLTSNAADKLAFVRNTIAPQTFFTANLALTWSVSDANESGANQGVISTTTPLAFNGGGGGIAFDGGGASSGKEFRYGQLATINAIGSQVLPLPFRLFTRYWNGTSFIANTADNCTTLAGTNIEMGNFQSTLGPIASCKTRLPATITFNAGRATALLTAPGSSVGGSVDLTVHLESAVIGTPKTCTGGTPSNVTGADRAYLQGRWTGAAYDQNPLGRAVFGSYPGSSEVIYSRENY